MNETQRKWLQHLLAKQIMAASGHYMMDEERNKTYFALNEQEQTELKHLKEIRDRERTIPEQPRSPFD